MSNNQTNATLRGNDLSGSSNSVMESYSATIHAREDVHLSITLGNPSHSGWFSLCHFCVCPCGGTLAFCVCPCGGTLAFCVCVCVCVGV